MHNSDSHLNKKAFDSKHWCFIVVAHDVWDSKRIKLNGLSIFITHPVTLWVYRIPVALTPPIRESAVDMEDFYSTANDNYTTAVKAGQLTICRDQGETMNNRAEEVESGLCYMHLGGLALGLALSFTKHTTAGVQTNYWAPFCDLYKTMKAMLPFLFDRKHKSCFKDYKNSLQSMHQEVLSISLPNSTRVAGSHIFAAKGLNKPEWRQLAQFEAMIWLAMHLCLKSQGDCVELGGEMVLILISLLAEYEDKDADKYNVVDVDNLTGWEATTSFRCLPMEMMTATPEKAHDSVDISLMTTDTVELKSRYIAAHNCILKTYPMPVYVQ
eukprot:10709525-Ditylum_brightwellii.AAC.1